jgi:hypothetical protein
MKKRPLSVKTKSTNTQEFEYKRSQIFKSLQRLPDPHLSPIAKFRDLSGNNHHLQV